MKRIGISTGGGDCPGLNAVIRGIVKAAACNRGWEVVGIEDGFEGILRSQVRPLSNNDVKGILTKGGTILGTSNRGNPFDYPVPQPDGSVVRKDISGRLVENIKEAGIDAMICIGGDGTLTIAQQLIQRGIPVVGVPKTIDNDLLETDVTFGYNTALGVASDALDRLHSTGESHHRVMVLEVMGRYAGWLALESGIAGAADGIVIPEIPFSLETLAAMVRSRAAQGDRYSVIVAAEGAIPVDGERVIKQSAGAGRSVERLGGVGELIGRQLEEVCGVETRTTVLGHLQRGGSPSVYDRVLASRFGVKAMEMIEAGDFGSMCALKGRDIVSVPIDKAVQHLKLVDPDGKLVRDAEKLGICMGR